MNREEAIYFANCLKNNYTVDLNDMEAFCDMAIKALEQEPITSKDKFIYALTACGCLLKDGKTWYEHNELIECFENLGLLENSHAKNKESMTKEEAKEFIAQSVKSDVDMALVADVLKVLEQEPIKPMVEIDLYSVIKQKYIEREVLDKIRAEIRAYSIYVMPQYGRTIREADALYIIDKYKAETEAEDGNVD